MELLKEMECASVWCDSLDATVVRLSVIQEILSRYKTQAPKQQDKGGYELKERIRKYIEVHCEHTNGNLIMSDILEIIK